MLKWDRLRPIHLEEKFAATHLTTKTHSPTMSAMTKYLLLSMAMTMVTVPVFIYSNSIAKRYAAPAEPVALETALVQAPEPTALSASSDESEPVSAGPNEQPGPAPDESAEQTPSPNRFSSLAALYRPPLFGKCKKLFERFNRKKYPDKPFKAFVYSFDGETAFCADAYTDKGQAAAEEIVLRECEEHYAGSGKYSPCRIYSVE